MALIKCPECGKEVSDKASQCPQCGYPIHEKIHIDVDFHEIAHTNEAEFTEPKKDKTIRSSKVIVIALLLVAVIIGGCVFAFISLNSKNIRVNSIDLAKWRLTDQSTYVDDCEGTVISETKKPFVAVIGYYEDTSNFPELVYMEDGEGTLQISESKDEDPSVKYNPIGYISGKKVQEKDFKNIVVTDSDYTDYEALEETDCKIAIKFDLKFNKSGILLYDVIDDTTKEKRINCYAMVSAGKSEDSLMLSDLPYKTRGVDVKVFPKFFCEAEDLDDTDYGVEKPFNIEKEESTYSSYFVGIEELDFQGYDDGAVLYTTELKEGGRKEDRGKIRYTCSHLKDTVCNIGTFYVVSDEDTVLEPKYEINVIGYIPWKKL